MKPKCRGLWDSFAISSQPSEVNLLEYQRPTSSDVTAPPCTCLWCRRAACASRTGTGQMLQAVASSAPKATTGFCISKAESHSGQQATHSHKTIQRSPGSLLAPSWHL